MCGLTKVGVCKFSELKAGQLGVTKQLVLRIALPHVSLLLAAVSYAFLGSWLISLIIHINNDSTINNEIDEAKKQFIYQTIAIRHGNNETQSHVQIEKLMHLFTDKLFAIYWHNPKLTTRPKPDPTHITRNLFFTVTTLTSIGYGTNAPCSVVGRIFIVLYILLGIPLYLITLADMAKFCTEFMNRLFTEYLKQKYQLVRRFHRWRSGRRQSLIEIIDIIIAGGEDEIAEFLWTHLENTRFIEVPFLVVYTVLTIYVVAASFIISSIEGWKNCDAFYFVVMSILTIGFGDFVPSNSTFILLTLLIIIIGLILATTCIDVAGAYYINRLHFFGRQTDKQNPLLWLKTVQQSRIENMKREAMRRLFETVSALHHLHLGNVQHLKPIENCARNKHLQDILSAPKEIIAYNATAESVTLKWIPSNYLPEKIKFWYTLAYKTRTPQGSNNPITIIDFINTEEYRVENLRSFTLYEFSVAVTTKFGSGPQAKCQEYTEPCTVPQLLRLIAVSTETATFSWKAPRKNNGPESYVIQFSQQPAPQFQFWQRYQCGRSKTFTITNLIPNTRYIMCVSAEHNYGLAAMSKSIHFKTKEHWYDNETSSSVVTHEEYATFS